MEYKLVLGLEIHIQPKTSTKMFCGCGADIWGADPNTHTCPVCLGLPGALPVPNYEAVEKTQTLGLALDCELNENSRFDRKHYFYPDLPKGYQISQYKKPFCEYGKLVLDSGFEVTIDRIHLEEDTAKSFHENGQTLIDFNKSGMPLIEIVTSPCFRSVADAVEYSKQIRTIARLLNISEADMEKGQMRIEPNISLRTAEMEQNDELPDYKVEIKNINSFKFMEKAVLAEIERQTIALDNGVKLTQENRGYDEAKNITVPQRSKEEAKDYRYFPEPDIPPMVFAKKYFDELKSKLPELPNKTKTRLVSEYGLDKESVRVLVDNLGNQYVLKLDEMIKFGLDPKKSLNTLLNKKETVNLDIEEIKNSLNTDSGTMTDTEEISKIVTKVISLNSKAVEDYKNGKSASLEFLLGMVMRESKGKANADTVRKLLIELI